MELSNERDKPLGYLKVKLSLILVLVLGSNVSLVGWTPVMTTMSKKVGVTIPHGVVVEASQKQSKDKHGGIISCPSHWQLDKV